MTVKIVNNKGENAMKKLMTVVFATMIAVTLSAPAWSQAPAGAAAQSKAAKNEKNEKKEAAKAEKAKKKAEKQAAKQTKNK